MKQIIIIGAGISGLYAAWLLAKDGYKVIVLEASERIGGRIHTINNPLFDQPAELGAEFVHGNLPVTLGLLKQAGIAYQRVEGESLDFYEGRLKRNTGFIENWDLFEDKLKELREDITVDVFLAREFSGAGFADLRKSVRRYASGFDTADTAFASMLSLKNEWLHEEEEQYRIVGGYKLLVKYIADQFYQSGGEIYFKKQVEQVNWMKNSVQLKTSGGEVFSADNLLVTVSLGILKSGIIKFQPSMPRKEYAVQKMGFGAIIKVLLQFDTAFWEEIQGDIGKDAGFILSELPVPTWWTQSPRKSALLTGWLGGPEAARLANYTDAGLLALSVSSLAKIFGMQETALTDRLRTWRIINWTNDVLVRGSYSYPVLKNDEYVNEMLTPVAQTIYFAGEAFYRANATSTVEAALVSSAEAVSAIKAYSS